MPPRRPHAQDAAPNRALDAARSGLQHLQEQERMLTTKCLPRDNPVEAAFKAPDPLPHSYAPRPPVSRSSAGAPVPLRIPQALTAISASPGEYAAPEDLSSGGAVSYSKVRRWEVLPKHAWLQAAESGHGPGPGFRDVSATQTLRSFGPKQLEEPAPAEGSVIEEAPASSKPQATLGMSATVGQHYTPSAKGLVPATLMAALAEGLPEVAEEDEEDESAEQEAVMLSTFSPETTTATDAEVSSSFLPLAFFDSEDMESMADTVWPSIEESFNSGHPYMARSRYHGADGKVSMFECEVVRYLPEEAKFEIQWIHNGRRKTVTRLNLLFDDELESKFTERVHVAKALRSAFEADIRYFLFAMETIDGNSLTTSDAVLNELHFKKRTVGADEARWQGKAAQQSLAELRTEYVAAMKLATLNYEMLSAPFRNKIKPLKLPRPKVKPVPEQGCVVLPETETKDARKCMQDNLFHADATLLACTRMVFDESYWMRDTLLLSTRLDYLDPPSSLSNFVTVQSSTLDSVRTKLLTSWVPGVESIVHQELGTLPEFEHAMDEKQFLESRIPRFLKQIGLLMQDELQLMVLESMRAYLELLNLFATPQAELHKKPEEWVHALPNADPALLSITLKLKDGMLLYEPSLEQVTEKLKQCLEAFVDQTDNIPQIGNKGMRSYTLPEQTLNTLRKDDRQLVGARVDLEQLLDASLMRPRQLLELYQNFEELAHVVVEEHLATIESEKCTLNQYSEEITKWNRMADEVMSATPSEVHCRLLLVSCGMLKETLARKARSLATGVAMLVVTELQERTASIADSYKLIYERLQTQSATAEEVVEMNAYLQSCELELTDLQIGIDNDIKGRLDLLEGFMANLPDEVFSMVYDTLGWPARVHQVAMEATTKQEEDRQFFMEQLRTDREKFADELDEWDAEIRALNALGGGDNPIGDVETNAATVMDLQKKLDDAKERAALYSSREQLFGWETTDYPQINEHLKALEPHLTLWTTALNFQRSFPTWMEGPFLELSPEQVELDVGNWWRTLYKLGKNLVGLDNPLKVVAHVKEKLDDFKSHLPLILAMLNPGMRERHWKMLTEKVGHSVQPNEMSTLASMLDTKVEDHLAVIQDASDMASKEHSLEKSLDKMVAEWRPQNFDCMEYRDSGTYILRALDDIQTLFDDHIVKTQAMRGSPFIKPFESRVKDWETRLITMQEIIDEWLKCQSVWLYLEPIFSSEDIMRQMPQEAKRFTQVDRLWRKVMGATAQKPNVLVATSQEGLLQSWQEANRLLELIQQGLNDYLEAKRLSFARLFFLSNDELLQILSETKDPQRVQPHLKKCFEGIAKLNFTKENIIKGMFSVEGELVGFNKDLDPNAANGMVEKWLLEVEHLMKENISIQTKKSHADYPTKERTQWLLDWPGMVVLAIDQIYWTQEVENALDQGGLPGLKKYEEVCTSQLDDVVRMVRGKITKLQRCTIGAMVTLDVHGRDVLTMMVEQGCESTNDFNWIAQLRYYYNPTESDDMQVKIITAIAKYGWEYLGNSFRLVVTQLTDRCYRTLMSAIQLTLGGAPEGPAGTGKTETTKDLAKALAKQCVVFNCSDGLDFRAMAKFFKGLAASGAWACFDEFNRIDLEVLSVIAQQILTIQRAIAAGVRRFIFEGTDLPIDPTNAVFITMNPGYAGRSELPDNLKALFRPCAMMVPDYALIGEISLMSFGFSIARPLAQKIVQTYKLCSEQLSSQDHYDYGMRAVKSVLTAAGNLKRAYPDDDEKELVLRSIRDVNVPKFLSPDIPLFDGITSDLFPGVELPPADYDKLKAAITTVLEQMQLQEVHNFVVKVIEVYEMFLVRHGFMIVGLPYSGKTCCYRVLAAALSLMAEQGDPDQLKVQHPCLNPKSVPPGRLYGEFDPISHEWTDGILAVIYRNCAQDTSGERRWMVFDGPVDAVWIENMNTVLDDNKKLCLMSGEIIAMSPVMNLIFEPMDLAVASPATVSRCGMVYMEPSQLGWRPLMLSWLATLPAAIDDAQKALLTELFDWMLEPCLWYMRRYCRSPVPTQDIQLAVSVMRLIESHLDIWRDLPDQPAKPPDSKKGCDALQCLFLMSLTWGVGATVDEDGRAKFDAFLRQLIKKEVPESLSTPGAPQPIIPSNIKMSKPPPDKGSVFDAVFKMDSFNWADWMTTVPAYVVPKGSSFHEIFVQTEDTVQAGYFTDVLVTHSKPLLLCGNTGTGKTILLRDRLLNGLNHEVYQNIFLNFSAQTSARVSQNIIDSQLDKRRKGIFGPPYGKKCVVMVDDLNMPALQTYGDQPPIELLRQWMDHDGWYDLKECTFRTLVDIQFVAAMGPPGGGRNPVTPRYLRHFNLLWMTDYSSKSLEKIFVTVFQFFFGNYPGEIQSLCNTVVQSTINVYKTISRELLPTPSKSHYTFNLRDLSKVFQGITQASPKTVVEPKDLICLWLHEMLRVFSDRLIERADTDWFHDQLLFSLKEGFKKEWEAVTGSEDRRIIFGDFMEDSTVDYIHLTDMEALTNKMALMLDDYNAISKTPMELVLFPFAIEHICRVLRVIKQPFGNALLAGVGGSGRQSLTALAAHVAQFEVFRIELSKNYDMTAWREDLKRLLRTAGEACTSTVFLFTDTQVKDEAMIEDINNILNAGEVPNLFPSDEKSQIAETLGGKAKDLGWSDISPSGMERLFVQQCRTNLHVVLCMSPIGDAFRTRLRKFPSLINCCTIDWFTAWPKDALLTVAQSFIRDIKLEDDVRASILEMCSYFQASVADLSKAYFAELRRHNYVTPTSYLELLNAFRSLLDVKRGEVARAKERYDVGLNKLTQTADAVAGMQAELTELQPKLVVARREADDLMVVIERDSADAQATREIVEKEEAAANVKADEAMSIKEECEAGLAEALPALDSAVKALKTLKKDDVTEVKNMKSPPAGVKLTMEAVCIMKEVPPIKVAAPDGRGKVDDYWEPSKKMMNDTKFLESLQTYDKDNIKASVIEKIKAYVTNPDFDPPLIAKASKAAYGLCCWVRAMEVYDRVAKDVAPKRARLAQAEAEYAEVSALLETKKAALKEVEDKIAALQAQFAETTQRKEELEKQADDCTKKLDRASKLIGGLGGEKDRWTEASAALGEVYNNIVGDVLIGSGVVSYMGPFTAIFRDRVITEWIQLCAQKKVPCSAKFSLTDVLGDAVKIRAWNIDGLPKDSFSVDNGIITSQARRWPLMIDPQQQANKWVKNMEKSASMITFKLTDGDFARSLEMAVQFGRPALLENINEEIDPVLEPILLKQVFKSAGVMSIRLGDATVEYNKDFKFYITTKLRNPHYLPEVSVKVTLLNFMITPEGLEDQLLGLVVAKERPELEEEKSRLILEAAENKRQLKEIEDKILRVLSESSGNILDDQSAIDILSSSKRISDDIAQKQVASIHDIGTVAEATTQRLDKTREGYQPVAYRSSILFFSIADMGNVDPMYQYSLAWYVNLFVRAIEDAEQSKNLEDRLEFLKQQNTISVYRNVCRSLYEKDKLLFAFVMCTNIMRGDNDLDHSLFMFFLTGGAGLIPDDAPKNPAPHWLSDRAWTEMLRLSEYEGFEKLCRDFALEIDQWQELFDSAEPHKMKLPGHWQEDLNDFQVMCILRCLRPDKVTPMVTAFVDARMGRKYIEPPPFNLEDCYSDSTATSPLIFVLSPGQDPMTQLLKFADARGFGGKRTQAISLGQGQGPIAQRLISDALSNGSWVVLQNCHLSVSWMPTLEKICEEITLDRASPDFRLWLTSAPSSAFPVSILQNGVKMTNEPPKGLRANILGSYLSDPISDPEFFEGVQGANAWAWKPMMFGLAFFHAVVQERRKFGAIGWNIPYEFNNTDLRISVRQVRLFLESYDSLPIEALNYCTGEANYGGRVTDDKDRRCAMAILRRFFNVEALEAGHRFCAEDAPGADLYTQPGGDTHDDYVAHIRELPMISSPEVFGLHANAAITKDLKETRELFEACLLTQASAGGGGGGGGDAMLARIAEDIASKLPGDFDLEAVQAVYPVDYLQSMNTVLAQELTRFNRLIVIIRKSLANLKKAIKGLVVMDAELEAVATALMQGARPAMWMKRSYPSLKPLGSYVTDLLRRLQFLQDWIDKGMPDTFWVSGFFFTQAFLTGALQNFARKHKHSIDSVAFSFNVLAETPSGAPEDGVYIYGIYLEGARFDKETMQLGESEPKILFTELPMMWLRSMEVSTLPDVPHYMCPLYKTSDRRGTLSTTGHSTNFVMYLQLPSDMEHSHWVQRGVAGLCGLDD